MLQALFLHRNKYDWRVKILTLAAAEAEVVVLRIWSTRVSFHLCCEDLAKMYAKATANARSEKRHCSHLGKETMIAIARMPVKASLECFGKGRVRLR